MNSLTLVLVQMETGTKQEETNPRGIPAAVFIVSPYSYSIFALFPMFIELFILA